ncbi:MAG: hypothetical protein CM1200mP24_09080 [Gammaproteobacteria bacterium]|nr:MAG: hypothetical protein CM1200mP24_09080 [Gammaproteobacteria bacterium]
MVPPDLSVTARYRRPDWIYTYMRSFYIDDSSPTGWNNTVFPDVAMPNVLYEWQGYRKAKFTNDESGSHFKKFEQLTEGR